MTVKNRYTRAVNKVTTKLRQANERAEKSKVPRFLTERGPSRLSRLYKELGIRTDE